MRIHILLLENVCHSLNAVEHMLPMSRPQLQPVNTYTSAHTRQLDCLQLLLQELV